MSKKGFTLIELLVVIAIIAILSTIGFVNYQQAVKKGRDARRQADLRTIQSALEQYHTDNHFYPYTITFDAQLDNCSIGVPSTIIPTCPTASKIYLKTVPKDPRNVSPNVYTYTPSGAGCASATPNSCTSYCLYADLEAETTATNFASGCITTGDFSVTRP